MYIYTSIHKCFSCDVRTWWGKLMRQVSEQCLFELPATILDTCFQAEETMKVFSQMSRRVSLSLSQFKSLFIRGFSRNALYAHTHTQAHGHIHTAPSLGSCVLWVSALCVFSITRHLITLSAADSSPSVACLTDMQPYYRWREEVQD